MQLWSRYKDSESPQRKQTTRSENWRETSHQYYNAKYFEKIKEAYEEAKKYFEKGKTESQDLSKDYPIDPKQVRRIEKQEVRLHKLFQELKKFEDALLEEKPYKYYELLQKKLEHIWETIVSKNF